MLTIIKGRNSIVNLRPLARNNPNLDLVKVKSYVRFDQMPSIPSQDIELKRNSEEIQGP